MRMLRAPVDTSLMIVAPDKRGSDFLKKTRRPEGPSDKETTK
jgi:hypothetical protein